MSDDLIRFNCPGCQKKLNAPGRKAGKSFPCPACSSSITVPFPLATAHPVQTQILPPLHAVQMAPPAPPPTQQVVIIQQAAARPEQSNTLAAVLNFLIPSLGYLVQGRIFAFLAYWFAFAFLVVVGIATAGIGLFLIPILWIISIVDAANYKG